MNALFIKGLLADPKIKYLSSLGFEACIVLYITPNGRVFGRRYFESVGNAEKTVPPSIKSILEGCRINNAKKIILIHNHPYIDGDCDCNPSHDDLKTTAILRDCLLRYGIEIEDHIIVTPDGQYYSFKEHGLL